MPLFCCSGSKGKPFISLEMFMDFINRRQRDSRLNEVLYPPLKKEQVRQIMERYETNTSQLERGNMSVFLFTSPSCKCWCVIFIRTVKINQPDCFLSVMCSQNHPVN